MEIQGVGIGYQTLFHQDVLDHRNQIDFVEMAPEIFGQDFQLARELQQAQIPISLHGLHLSFASDSGWNEASIQKAKSLLHETQAPWFSDHFSYTSEHETDSELYIPPHLTEKSLISFRDRLTHLHEVLQVPIHLENVATLFINPFNEMMEGEFLSRLFFGTESKLILNLDSILISSNALHIDPFDLLETYPLDYVESITVVPTVSMNTMMQQLYSKDIEALIWELLDYSLIHSSAKSVLVQRRFAQNTFSQMKPFIEKAQQLFRQRRLS